MNKEEIIIDVCNMMLDSSDLMTWRDLQHFRTELREMIQAAREVKDENKTD